MYKKGEIALALLFIGAAVIATFAFLGADMNGPTGMATIEPQAAISSCGALIGDDSWLTGDLHCNGSVPAALTFVASNVELDCRGHTIYANWTIGIQNGPPVNNITIRNCTVETIDGTQDGIYLANSTNNTIQDVIVNHITPLWGSAIYLEESDGCHLDQVTILHTSQGIYAYDSSHTTISNITMVASGPAGNSIWITHNSRNLTNTTITDFNITNEAQTVIYVESGWPYYIKNTIIKDGTIHGGYNNVNGIELRYTNTTQISDVNITFIGGAGVYLRNAFNVDIESVNANGSYRGLYLDSIDFGSIKNSSFYSNQSGIYITNCNNFTINNVEGTGGYGLFMYNSDGHEMENVNFTGTDSHGAKMEYCDNNKIRSIKAITSGSRPDADGLFLRRSANNWFKGVSASSGRGYHSINVSAFNASNLDPQAFELSSILITGWQSQNNNFTDVNIYAGDYWIKVGDMSATGNDFTNVTFRNDKGRVTLNDTFTLWQAPLAWPYGIGPQLDIKRGEVYMDTANLPPDWNQSAKIRINYVQAFNNIAVDSKDDGNFTNCTICTNVNYNAAGDYVTFNVPHWTTYQANGTVEFGCGSPITGDVTLTDNLTSYGGTCFTLDQDNMVFDCAGHTIKGFESGTGIVAQADNVTVRNCRLIDLGIGVVMNTTNGTLENSNIDGMATNAVKITESGCTVRNSRLRAGDETALIEGNFFSRVFNTTFINTTIISPGYTTIKLEYHNDTEFYDTRLIIQPLGTPIAVASIEPEATNFIVEPGYEQAIWVFNDDDSHARFHNGTLFEMGDGYLDYSPEKELVVPGLVDMRVQDFGGDPDSISFGVQELFVNGTKYPFLNQSANITFFNVTGLVTQAYWDNTDTYRFLPCPATVCTDLTQTGSNVTVEVQHFTYYSVKGQPYINFYTSPNSTSTFDKNVPFTFRAYLECLGANCGNITVVLDPAPGEEELSPTAWTPKNEWNASVSAWRTYYNSPTVAKVGSEYLIFVAGPQAEKIFAFNSTGANVWNFTHPWANTQHYFYQTPAVGDVDNDSQEEVVVFETYLNSDTNKLFVIDAATGALETYANITHYSNQITSPTISDLDGDGINEIIVSTQVSSNGDSYIYVYNVTAGQVVEKWNRRMGSPFTCYCENPKDTTPAVVDVNNDGVKEIITTCDSNGYPYCSIMGAWNGQTGSYVWKIGSQYNRPFNSQRNSPTLADIDQDGTMEIILPRGSNQGQMLIYDASNGNLERTVTTYITGAAGDYTTAPASIADINSDGDLEMLYMVGEYIIATQNDGTHLWNYSTGDTESASARSLSAVVADLNGDGTQEVAFHVDTGVETNITILNGSNGAKMFSRQLKSGGGTGSMALVMPLVEDIDQDGSLELITLSAQGWLQSWSFTGAGTFSTNALLGGKEWPMFMTNKENTGLYGDLAQSIQGTANLRSQPLSTAMPIYCSGTVTAKDVTYNNVWFNITSPLSGSYLSNGTYAGGTYYSDNVTIDALGTWTCEMSVNNTLSGGRAGLASDSTYVGGNKTGAVSTVPGTKPFWTSSSNPQTCVNLQQNDTCVLSWTVIPTGNSNSTWEFFAEITDAQLPAFLPAAIIRILVGQRTTPFFISIGGPGAVPINLSVQKTDTPDPVNVSQQLNYSIIVNITSGNVTNLTITESYPAEVTFVNASPLPTTGNNIWRLGNYTGPTIVRVNITTLVKPNVANGTIIFNNANISFQNSTNDTIVLILTENTTVLNPGGGPAPTPRRVGGGGSSAVYVESPMAPAKQEAKTTKTKEEPTKPKQEKAAVQEEKKPKQDIVAIEKPVKTSMLAVFSDDKGQKTFRAFFYALAILALLVIGTMLFVRHQNKKKLMHNIEARIEELKKRVGKL